MPEEENLKSLLQDAFRINSCPNGAHPFLRTFIAIDLPEHIKNILVELQQILKDASIEASWVKPRNMHLTLKFIGDTPNSKIEGITGTLSEISEEFKPFEAKLLDFGVFPNAHSPKIIWVGLDDNFRILPNMAGIIEGKMQKWGFKREHRPFTPHLTLARIRSRVDARLLKEKMDSLKGYFDDKKTSFPISHISLIKSTLTLSGPLYDLLFKTELRCKDTMFRRT